MKMGQNNKAGVFYTVLVKDKGIWTDEIIGALLGFLSPTPSYYVDNKKKPKTIILDHFYKRSQIKSIMRHNNFSHNTCLKDTLPFTSENNKSKKTHSFFTVISKLNGGKFSDEDMGSLLGYLSPRPEIYYNKKKPRVLYLDDYYDHDRITHLLNFTELDYQIYSFYELPKTIREKVVNDFV